MKRVMIFGAWGGAIGVALSVLIALLFPHISPIGMFFLALLLGCGCTLAGVFFGASARPRPVAGRERSQLAGLPIDGRVKTMSWPDAQKALREKQMDLPCADLNASLLDQAMNACGLSLPQRGGPAEPCWCNLSDNYDTAKHHDHCQKSRATWFQALKFLRAQTAALNIAVLPVAADNEVLLVCTTTNGLAATKAGWPAGLENANTPATELAGWLTAAAGALHAARQAAKAMLPEPVGNLYSVEVSPALRRLLQSAFRSYGESVAFAKVDLDKVATLAGLPSWQEVK